MYGVQGFLCALFFMIHFCILYILMLPLFVKGFGNSTFFALSCFTLLAYILYCCKRKQEWFIVITLGVVGLISPSVMHLWAFIALCLTVVKRTRHFCVIPALMGCVEMFYVPITHFSLFITYSFLFTLCFLFTYRGKEWWNIICICCALIFSLIDLSSNFVGEEVLIEKYQHNSVYAPSDQFCKLTSSRYLSSQQKSSNILRSLAFSTSIQDSIPGIVIHEINTVDNFSVRHCQLFQQPTSWHHNQLLGNQYLLESIAKDGGLYSNKGVCFKDTGEVKLALPLTWIKSQPLIITLRDITHLHDSDYTTSYLSNYQSNLNNEIVRNGNRHILLRLFSFLLLVCILLEYFPIVNSRILHLSKITTLILFFYIYCPPVRGEIRIAGRITNSHENYKFDGVLKSLVESGFAYKNGNVGTKILIVPSNKTAIRTGESVVVLENNAKILTRKGVIKSGDIPIGNHNEVLDARSIIVGDQTYLGKYQEETFVVLSTGSPSKIKWENILN